MITVKIIENETGRVIFETNNARGVMGVIAVADRAQGVVHLENDIPETYTMLEVLEDIKRDVLSEDADLTRFAEYMATRDGAVILNN